MANNTTKKAGSNKSFIDRMGGQKFIVLLVVIALFIFFCAMSPNFRKYTTFINILDFSYYIVLMAIGVVMTFVLNHTRIGRYTLAIGSNKEATRLSGVNVRFYHIAAYVICGFFAGLASIAYSAIFATVQPGSGAGFELEAIGGAIIGGVSMTGGVGSITGTLFGVFVICLLKTGLPFIGLTANWQQIITGFVLIAAVLVDILKRKAGKE